jgi:hypothetical protein
MDHFHHLDEFRLLVCKACRYAVLRPQLNRHLGDHHKDLSAAHRRAIIDELSQLAVLQRDEEVRSMRLPDPGQLALPCLPVHDGFRCTLRGSCDFCDGSCSACDACDSCDYVAGSIRSIQNHCRGPPHNWRKSRKVTGYPWVAVRCQTFFTKRSLVRYFEVSAGPQPGPDATHAGRAGQLEAIRQQYQAKLEQKRALVRQVAPLEVNPWLEKTGWTEHLRGQSPTAMEALVSAPVDGSPHVGLLKRTGKLFDLIMLQALKTARPGVCGSFSLFAVNSLEAGMEARLPLRVNLEKDTVRRYSDVWKKILYYILRTHDGDEPPLYNLTPQQSAALQRYLQAVEQWGPEVDEAEVEPTAQRQRANALSPDRTQAADPTTATATPATEGTALADAPVSPVVATVAGALLKLCIQLLDHTFEQVEYESAVISGLAVIAVDGNGWTDAQNYTPKLSAVIKVAQLLVVQHAWETKQDNRAASALNEIKDMTKRFLQVGTYTPIHWVYHLRQYGKAITKWASGPGTVEWVGDKLRYRTIEFSMEMFRLFVHGLILAAHAQLHEELLMVKSYKERPVAAVAKLKDDAARLDLDWSFIKDARNHWLADKSNWLEERMLNDFHDDWLYGEEGLRWKMGRVYAYMESITRFMDRLLVLMHVTGGQPARSQELLGIRYCNTAGGGRRNIFIEDGLVVYVTQYHKGYGLDMGIRAGERP